MPVRIFSALILVGLLSLTAGCNRPGADGASAQPLPTAENTFTAGGGGSLFYGEAYKNGRFYLFGTKMAWNDYVAQGDIDPKIMLTMIGKGPGKKTLVVQVDKESKVMQNRLVDTVTARYQP
jgi:hypothetical protein